MYFIFRHTPTVRHTTNRKSFFAILSKCPSNKIYLAAGRSLSVEQMYVDTGIPCGRIMKNVRGDGRQTSIVDPHPSAFDGRRSGESPYTSVCGLCNSLLYIRPKSFDHRLLVSAGLLPRISVHVLLFSDSSVLLCTFAFCTLLYDLLSRRPYYIQCTSSDSPA